MTQTYKFAKQELALLAKSSIPGDFALVLEFKEEILALCEKVGRSGQSGLTAPVVAQELAWTIKKLCLFQPVSPLTGGDAEWCQVSINGTFQNKRDGAVFKERKEGFPYYLDAIVFKDQFKHQFTTMQGVPCTDGRKISSAQRIKAFPFTPKTFYIDVTRKEIAKDDWVHTIKDERQLKRVFAYYDEFKPPVPGKRKKN